MNRIVKIAACLLSVVLFVFLLTADYSATLKNLSPNHLSNTFEASSNQEQPEENAESESAAATEMNIQSENEAQIPLLQETLDELNRQLAPVQVALCVDQIGEIVYNNVYPELAARNYTALAVMKNNWIPGGVGRITLEQYQELLSAGWTFAVGGSNSVALQDANGWQSQLDTYLTAIQARVGQIPAFYRFDVGEYNGGYDSVLESVGFTGIACYPEDAAMATGALGLVEEIFITEDTSIDELFSELNNCSSALIVARVALDDAVEENQISLTSYFALIDGLASNEMISIVSVQDALAAGSNIVDRQALQQQIDEVMAQLEELRSQG